MGNKLERINENTKQRRVFLDILFFEGISIFSVINFNFFTNKEFDFVIKR